MLEGRASWASTVVRDSLKMAATNLFILWVSPTVRKHNITKFPPGEWIRMMEHLLHCTKCLRELKFISILILHLIHRLTSTWPLPCWATLDSRNYVSIPLKPKLSMGPSVPRQPSKKCKWAGPWIDMHLQCFRAIYLRHLLRKKLCCHNSVKPWFKQLISMYYYYAIIKNLIQVRLLSRRYCETTCTVKSYRHLYV